MKRHYNLDKNLETPKLKLKFKKIQFKRNHPQVIYGFNNTTTLEKYEKQHFFWEIENGRSEIFKDVGRN